MRLVAKPPRPIGVLAQTYGPHQNFEPAGGWEESARRPPDRLVKTHCSFCGMQCGIQLKVLDEKHLLAVKDEMEKITPMKAVFDRNYVKRLEGSHVKTGRTKMES